MTAIDNMAAQLEAVKMQVSGLESSLRVNGAFQQGQQLTAVASPPVLTTAHANSLGTVIAAMGLGATSAIAWPAVNEYVFEPVIVATPMATRAPSCYHSAGAGNYETGLYDSSGRLLVSSSNGAASNTINISTGLYFMAMWGSATTLTFLGWTAPIAASDIGVDWQGTASALPSSRLPDSSNTLFTFVPLLSIGLPLWQGF